MRFAILFLCAWSAHAAPWSWWGGNQCPIIFAWEGAWIIDWLQLQPACSQFLSQHVSTVTSTRTIAGTGGTTTVVVPSTTTQTTSTVVTVLQTTVQTSTVIGATDTVTSTAPETTVVGTTTITTVVTQPSTVTITPSPSTVTFVSGTTTIIEAYSPAPSPTTNTSPAKRDGVNIDARGIEERVQGSALGRQFPSQWENCAYAIIRDSCEIALGLKPGAQTVTTTSTVTGSGQLSSTTVTSVSTVHTTQTSYTTSVQTLQSTITATETISGPTTTPQTTSFSTSFVTKTSFTPTTVSLSASSTTTTILTTVYATTIDFAPSSQYVSLSTSGAYSIYAVGAVGGGDAQASGYDLLYGGSPAFAQATMTLDSGVYSVVTGEHGEDGIYAGGGGGGTFLYDETGAVILAVGGGSGWSNTQDGADGGSTSQAVTGKNQGGPGSGMCGGGAGTAAGANGNGGGSPGYAGNGADSQWAQTSAQPLSGGGYGGGGAGCVSGSTGYGGGGGGYAGGSNYEFEGIDGVYGGGTSWVDPNLCGDPYFGDAPITYYGYLVITTT